ncbi:DUF523 domain-containing protein [Heliobacillus mobilis]|uniref:DUF523 domain-containing protein n=1 Tax=Heliobacterium mobile TaxID=28064 RepID=A0A6I3SGY0_HELMO|nr:DUF523 domain-containing protein [Heliobacterium mobile]MTV48101.1 DUF523 domain-containing protein [Heliobacterium mobile]
MILVSSCLLGIRSKYDGSVNTVEKLLDLCREGKVIPVCPEQLGGSPTPRPPVELIGDGGGQAVLSEKAQANTDAGDDVTAIFIEGAAQVLRIAQLYDANIAILKERSPSCGVHYIYDGSFTSRKITGQGVTTALLKQHGIQVYSEEDLESGVLASILEKEKRR